jgi:thiamine biosynthesis lipoprotein
VSATVVAASCTAADALATALIVLDEGEGVRLIEKLPDTECLLIVGEEATVVSSSGMSSFLENGTQ